VERVNPAEVAAEQVTKLLPTNSSSSSSRKRDVDRCASAAGSTVGW
jgi:hypothetical protein